jgi:hypothetical protein
VRFLSLGDLLRVRLRLRLGLLLRLLPSGEEDLETLFFRRRGGEGLLRRLLDPRTGLRLRDLDRSFGEYRLLRGGGLRLSRLWPRGAGWRSRGGVEETERCRLRDGGERDLECDLECRLGERYFRVGLKERDRELLVLKGDSREGGPRLRGDLDLDRDMGRGR